MSWLTITRNISNIISQRNTDFELGVSHGVSGNVSSPLYLEVLSLLVSICILFFFLEFFYHVWHNVDDPSGIVVCLCVCAIAHALRFSLKQEFID